MAFEGKYLSPVKEDGLPLFVLHFCLPHFTKEFERDFFPLYPPPELLYNCTANCALRADHSPLDVPCTALFRTDDFTLSHNPGSVL